MSSSIFSVLPGRPPPNKEYRGTAFVLRNRRLFLLSGCGLPKAENESSTPQSALSLLALVDVADVQSCRWLWRVRKYLNNSCRSSRSRFCIFNWTVVNSVPVHSHLRYRTFFPRKRKVFRVSASDATWRYRFACSFSWFRKRFFPTPRGWNLRN